MIEYEAPIKVTGCQWEQALAQAPEHEADSGKTRQLKRHRLDTSVLLIEHTSGRSAGTYSIFSGSASNIEHEAVLIEAQAVKKSLEAWGIPDAGWGIVPARPNQCQALTWQEAMQREREAIAHGWPSAFPTVLKAGKGNAQYCIIECGAGMYLICDACRTDTDYGRNWPYFTAEQVEGQLRAWKVDPNSGWF